MAQFVDFRNKLILLRSTFHKTNKNITQTIQVLYKYDVSHFVLRLERNFYPKFRNRNRKILERSYHSWLLLYSLKDIELAKGYLVGTNLSTR